MPLRTESRARCAGRSIALAIALICTCHVAGVSAQSADDSISDSQIEAAVETLKADPNLSRERTTRTLRWVDEQESKQAETGGFARWLMGFFTWLGELSRALVWVLGALLALVLVWFGIRLIRTVAPLPPSAPAALVPTHVRDLDIRPESLPSDIGAAALDLWQRAEHRAALALLYRGLLSRLAHTHGVPIRDSSTEGHCLELAARHLPSERHGYVVRLIETWQRATYGGRDPQTDDVQALCTQFDAALAPIHSLEARAR